MGLTQRSNPLYIFSPPGLKELIELHFKISQGRLPYELIFSELMEESVLFEDDQSLVECFKVMHRIDCWGFVFREKKNPRKIDPEKVHSHKVPVFFYHDLQHGEDYLAADGSLIPNEELTDTNDPPRSYAYCGDTGYYPPIVEKVKNVDLLYHEATYLHALEEKAVSRFHSTAAQAALIAKQANAKKLLIGHYSSIYSDPEVLQAEAASIFPNTECAREGTCIHV